MIDPQDIRERAEEYQRACENKGISLDISSYLELDEKYRALKLEVEGDRSKRNSVSKEIPKLDGDEKATKLEEMKSLSATLKEKEEKLSELDTEVKRIQLLIPSIPSPAVPVGKDDSANDELRKVGEIREFDFEFKDHVQLGKELDILDIERGVKIAGSRSYFLKGDGARLQHALMQFALNFLHQKGYTIMEVPHIVRYEAMMGTGYFPGGEESAYALDERDPNTHLIGTSEVSVCSYHKDEILPEGDLPIRMAGYSPCYRREAGTYGKDTHGIYRVHQFYKVEQVIICQNDKDLSAEMHAELLGNAESVMQLLDLPYRVVTCSTGDMGQGQIYKNDIEAWMPSRNGYGETHSCSTFYEFQARRLMIRYKDGEGKRHYCHTLNNTLVASTRMLIAMIENYQNKDGSVTIPEELRPYMGGQEVIEPK